MEPSWHQITKSQKKKKNKYALIKERKQVKLQENTRSDKYQQKKNDETRIKWKCLVCTYCKLYFFFLTISTAASCVILKSKEKKMIIYANWSKSSVYRSGLKYYAHFFTLVRTLQFFSSVAVFFSPLSACHLCWSYWTKSM